VRGEMQTSRQVSAPGTMYRAPTKKRQRPRPLLRLLRGLSEGRFQGAVVRGYYWGGRREYRANVSSLLLRVYGAFATVRHGHSFLSA
jgi:hypothetical protein